MARDDDSRVEVGKTHVRIFKKNSSTPVVAGILEKQCDPETGEPIYLVLDRLVHDKKEHMFGEFSTFGVFVTELTKLENSTIG